MNDCTHSNVIYAVVQNDVILDYADTYEKAVELVKAEQQKDLISIMFKKKLRKLFKKTGNVALHRYEVILIAKKEEIK